MTIVDEIQYQAIAENILNNHEFSLHPGQPTSMRPPVYPGFLSLVYFVTGGISFNTVRVIQIFLSLAVIYVIYLLGRDMFDEKNGLARSTYFCGISEFYVFHAFSVDGSPFFTSFHPFCQVLSRFNF